MPPPVEPRIGDIRLNKLSYNILGVLVRQPTSGYDVVRALEKFRPVNISQVYPLLSEMETQGLLTSDEVVQEGKPNKRVYSTTPLAHRVLRHWIDQPTEPPVLRDDFLSKVYSLWTCTPAEREKVVRDRIAFLEHETAHFRLQLRDLHAEFPDEASDPECWQFCRNVLMARRIQLYSDELLWCEGLLRKLAPPGPER
ncbi:MAG: helix-turn-helix transcriptional regulator [Rhodobacteraceae bacterium]|nr:helix-turn-helix transcriptional regulator [Paracoccaceae bacterium]